MMIPSHFKKTSILSVSTLVLGSITPFAREMNLIKMDFLEMGVNAPYTPEAWSLTLMRAI